MTCPQCIAAEWRVIGGLSRPSKLARVSLAWSISADLCNVGGKLADHPNTVCAICYAKVNSYTFPCVVRAMARRYRALLTALESESNLENFAASFSTVLEYYRTRERGIRYTRFRWFDSGDLQGLAHLELIVDIARRTPRIRHWLPTKEYGLVWRYGRLYGDFPGNLIVRVSGPTIGQDPPFLGRHISRSSVVRKPSETRLYQCPATIPGNPHTCAANGCTACWDSRRGVAYRLH